ncbi:MAG: hypothetical protein IJD91_04850 [Clostridia bacterium]|nr:hypothetical protein [Clostridia bacterium]
MIKIDKLFGDKKNNGLIYILLAMGIMLLILGNTTKKDPQQEVNNVYSSRAAEAEEILSEIKGAGKVCVMISDGEKDETSLLVSPEKKEKRDAGVLIVADGGNNSTIREKLVRAASVALGVSAHKIEVFERK